MGNIKKRNRTLHQEHHHDSHDMMFFEQIIKDEVKKAVHDAQTHENINYYPERTTDLTNRIHLHY